MRRSSFSSAPSGGRSRACSSLSQFLYEIRKLGALASSPASSHGRPEKPARLPRPIDLRWRVVVLLCRRAIHRRLVVPRRNPNPGWRLVTRHRGRSVLRDRHNSWNVPGAILRRRREVERPLERLSAPGLGDLHPEAR